MKARQWVHEALLRGALVATPLAWIPALLVSTSVVHDEHGSLFFKLSALAWEWLCVYAVCSLCLSLTFSPRSWVRAAGWSATGLFALGYLLSWGLFYGSAHFFNLSAMSMGNASFVLLLKHSVEFNPWLSAAIPLGSLGLAVGLFFVHRTLKPDSLVFGAKGTWRGITLAPILGVSALLVALFGMISAKMSAALVQNQKTGTVRTLPEHYRWVLRTTTGPFVHFAFDTFAPLAEGDAWELRTVALGTIRIPQSEGDGYQASVPTSASKHNVLVILVESLRRDALRTFGGKRNVMPHVDELAKKSQVFLRAYAQATHSDYADVTSLSGHFPLRARIHTTYPKNPPYPRVLLHDLLKPRGYRTAVISSQNEHWAGMLDFLSTPGLDHVFHSESFHRTYLPEEDEAFVKWTETWKRSGKLDDRDTVDELLRWMKEETSPFCVYVNLQNSHFPYRFEEGAPFQPSEIDFEYTFSGFPKDKLDIVRNRYHNSLRYIDDQLGRVITYLEDSGRMDDTIVLISGDTGQAFYEHGFATHGKLAFEELSHIPLVIHAPGLPPKRHETLMSQVDFTPSILDLLGMPPHPGHQGRSAFDEKEGAPRVVFTGRQLPGFQELAIVQDHFKFMLLGDGNTLLFDLDRDPMERTNLSAKHPELVETLRHTALSFRRAQLAYYADEERMASEYPPRLQVPAIKDLVP